MLDQHIQLADIPSQLQLIDRLQHLVKFSSNLTFVAGAAGSGKSIIIQRLLDQDLESNQSLLSCTPGIRAASAREQLLSQLVPNPLFNSSDNLGESFFRLIDEAPQDILLVIDDAHFLPQDVISELWLLLLENRFQGFNHHINVLLFAEPTWCQQQVALLAGKTEQPAIEMEIPALSESESHQFVRGLLARADYHAKVENNAAIHRQIEACDGLPACLQQLVDVIVNEPSAAEPASKVKNHNQHILIGLMVVAALLMSGAFYYFIVPQQDTELVENNDTLAMALLDEPVQTVTVGETLPSPQPTSDPVTPDALVSNWEDDTELPEQASQSDIELVKLDDGRKRVTLTEQAIADLGSASSDASAAQAQLSPEQMTADNVTVNSVAQLNQVLNQPIATEQQPDIESESGEQPSADVDTSPEPATAMTTEPSVEPESAPDVGFQLTSVAELKQIPSSAFSLQLAAVSSLPVLKAFVKEHGIEQSATYFKISRKGKTAYLVIYGQYKSRREAMNAINTLPTHLRTLKPWAKGYKQIQQEAID
ncbi:AAA family ATPase [Motilimonas sp. KMU-193]|uniref:AAA family ATPase n=1 Tax=Motilimonas sp. KMU-193 TaxID=3388668 RepID=UPI00396AF253